MSSFRVNDLVKLIPKARGGAHFSSTLSVALVGRIRKIQRSATKHRSPLSDRIHVYWSRLSLENALEILENFKSDPDEYLQRFDYEALKVLLQTILRDIQPASEPSLLFFYPEELELAGDEESAIYVLANQLPLFDEHGNA